MPYFGRQDLFVFKTFFLVRSIQGNIADAASTDSKKHTDTHTHFRG